MKIEIEVYKGQTIEYDDDADKFVCEMTMEDRFKTTKRLSLKDVRKEIDTFIKLNLEFKPFKAIFLESYDRKSFNVKEIKAIRTDGKFVVGDVGENSRYNSHYGKKEMSYCMVYDQDVINEELSLKNKLEDMRKAYIKGVSELCKKLVPVDLSRYEYVVNKDAEIEN